MTIAHNCTLVKAAASAPALASAPASAAPAPSRVAPFCGVTGVPSWAFTIPWEERLVDFAGHKTWVREVGKKEGSGGLFGLFGKGSDKSKGQRWPLLVVHGGPGLPSRYLETLELLAGQDRRVIFYDQIGCGNSFLASENRGPPSDDITVDMFVQEMAAVTQALGLQEHHMLGHGWGGMLALSSLAAGSDEERSKVQSLTLTGCPPSYKQLVADHQQKLEQLPEDMRAALRAQSLGEGQAQGLDEYNRRFVVQRPDASCLNAASSGQSATVNAALTGGKPFQAGGVLREWEAEPLMARVEQPVLILRGGNEELSLSSAQQLQSMRPGGVTIDTLPGAGSYAHIDAWEPYLEAVNTFMLSHDQGAA